MDLINRYGNDCEECWSSCEGDGPDYNTQADHLIALLSLVCFVVGLAGNALAFAYFMTRKHELSTCVYRCVTLCDVFLSLLALPVCLSYFSERAPVLFAVPGVCPAWGVVSIISMRLSVFLVAVLSITRSICLARPFYRMQTRTVLHAVGVYTAAQVATRLIDSVRHGNEFHYSEEHVDCSWRMDSPSGNHVTDGIMVLSYVIPIVPILASCVLSAAHLVRPARVHTAINTTNVMKRKASVTILLFVLTYAVFNIPLGATLVLYMVDAHRECQQRFMSFDKMSYYVNFMFVLSPSLNSALNPLLYFWRSSSFRGFIRDLQIEKRLSRRSVPSVPRQFGVGKRTTSV